MKNDSKKYLLIVSSLCFGFLGGVFGSALDLEELLRDDQQLEQSVQVDFDGASSTELTDVVERVMPSVVSISVVFDLPDPEFYDPFTGVFTSPTYTEHTISGGTGFIVEESGLVMTNRHVLEAAPGARYVATLYNGDEYPVEIVDEDDKEDVAILQILADEDVLFSALEFADVDELKIGQEVLAIGNALAVYGNTVTAGIVSAVGRDVAAYNDSGTFVENLSGLIQTDAAINLGNSGGPLFNLNGDVVGMNVAVAEANDIAFAIPADALEPILLAVLDFGEIMRPVLGARFLMLTEQQAKDVDDSLDAGALLIGDMSQGQYAVLPGGPAESAGLKEFDIILSLDGEELALNNPLHKVIRKYKPGDTVLLKIWRDGGELEIEVALGSSKEL